MKALLSGSVPDGQIDPPTGKTDFLVEERRLERGHVLGVEDILDIPHDQRGFAHATLAQQHHLEVVAPAVGLGVHRDSGKLRSRTLGYVWGVIRLAATRITASNSQNGSRRTPSSASTLCDSGLFFLFAPSGRYCALGCTVK
jgi:hypothetical protein